MRLITRTPWTSQPQVPVGIDRSSLLARDMAGLWTAVDSFGASYAQSGLTLPSTAAVLATTAGKMIQFDGSTKASSGVMTALKGNTTQPRTMLCLYRTGASISAYDVVASFDDTSGNAGLRLQADSTGTKINAWDSNANATSSVTFSANTKYVSVVRQAGGFLDLWTGGVNVAGTASTSINSGMDHMYVAGYGGAGANWKGAVGLVVWWNRALTDSEIVLVSSNPWQLFSPLSRTIWAPASAGGAFTPSITEAITLADTASQVASLSASISESLPLSHSQAAVANFPATITEAATLSHSQDAIVGYAVSNTETLNLSHSQTNVANFPATITEAMTLADSGTAQFGATSTISEAMTLADSSSNVAALSASITESMTLADSPNASASGDFTATQTEAMSLADTASNVAALSASITEPMSLSDSQSNVASLSASISESMTLADTSSSSLSGAAYSASITEVMTLADTATVQAALSAALTEAMSLGENATAAWMTYVSIVEALNLSDSRDGGVDTAWTASITEALGLADTVSSGSIGSSVRLFTNDIAVLTVPVPLFATTKTVDLTATTQS